MFGTIHPYHHAVTMMVLNHGKPVLCEKPLGMNYAESKEMIDLAKQKGVFFVEVHVLSGFLERILANIYN